jgi:hypothetical protein
VTSGTAIAATLGSLTAGIDFALPAVGCPTITVQPSTLPGGTVGSTYSATFTASGGVEPVLFSAGGTLPPELDLDGVSGVLAGTLTTAGTYTFDIVATDANGCVGNRSYTVTIANSATGTSLVTSAANVTYGTAVTLTATVTPTDATGVVTFSAGGTTYGTATLSGGSASLLLSSLNAGSYDFVATYNGDATHNSSTSNTVHVVVAKATPAITWSDPTPITYGTPVTVVQLNATASVPGSFNYSVATGTILDAGTYTLSVVFIPTDAANYNEASKSVHLTVNKATPAFSNLSSPVIIIGAPAVISGKISAGTLIPPGSVVITVNGLAQSVPIGSDGTFSATFDTSGLAPIAAGYPIGFSYGGSTNFEAITGAALLYIQYGSTGGPVTPNPKNGDAAIPFSVKIVDAAGNNLSSPSLKVVAYGVRKVSGGPWLPPGVPSNGDDDPLVFKFQRTDGGSYDFTLKMAEGLSSGQWLLGFTAGDDVTIHTVEFTIN